MKNTLREHVESKMKDVPKNEYYTENEVWAIQEYESCKGEFTEDDVKYLESLGYSVEDFAEEA